MAPRLAGHSWSAGTAAQLGITLNWRVKAFNQLIVTVFNAPVWRVVTEIFTKILI